MITNLKSVFFSYWNVYIFNISGSNTHNNGNPGGDGQTGDAGEGTKGQSLFSILKYLNLTASKWFRSIFKNE